MYGINNIAVGARIREIRLARGETFEEPITHGKNKFDVAFREFVRATLRGLIITLWGNEK